jgi:DNA-binding ferritin-like protein (Dps family)
MIDIKKILESSSLYSINAEKVQELNQKIKALPNDVQESYKAFVKDIYLRRISQIFV